MKLKLFIAQFYVPRSFKRAKMDELIKLTAKAFDIPNFNFWDNNYDKLLIEYAQFTRDLAENALANDGELGVIKVRLFTGAYCMGRELRRELGVKSNRDFRLASRLIYKALGIDFTCNNHGAVIIRTCFFSRFYSSAVCALISALDCGLIAGLSGGKQLSAMERMTENRPYCSARISP